MTALQSALAPLVTAEGMTRGISLMRDETIPTGLCQCGCGSETGIIEFDVPKLGWVKGQPKRFINHHRAYPPIEERFWAKVRKGDTDECWEWTAGRFASGYGAFRWSDGRVRTAHRVSYELASGTDPGDLFVCHSCDNRPCCNPAHLWLGTQADNAADMAAKGRSTKGRPSVQSGECHWQAKLTPADVEQIAAGLGRGVKGIDLARRFGVSKHTVSSIARGKHWGVR